LAKEVMPAYISPLTFILLRVGCALVLFLIFHALFIREKVARKDLGGLALSALFGVAANMLMFFEGLANTTPINASVLMMVTPIFVFVIYTVVNRQKISWIKAGGIALAAAGAMLLMGGKRLSFSKDTLYGDVFIILNALSYAVYLVYVKKFIKKYSPITVSKWNFIAGFIFVLPFGVGGLEAINWASFTPFVWFCFWFVLIGTTFITYLLNAWALQHAPSTLVGSYIYLQPVVATTLALVVRKDELTAEKIIFILLIFVGVYLVSLTPKKQLTE
jgi:drug/metabolite transporter (DMT)-like permease